MIDSCRVGELSVCLSRNFSVRTLSSSTERGLDIVVFNKQKCRHQSKLHGLAYNPNARFGANRAKEIHKQISNRNALMRDGLCLAPRCRILFQATSTNTINHAHLCELLCRLPRLCMLSIAQTLSLLCRRNRWSLLPLCAASCHFPRHVRLRQPPPASRHDHSSPYEDVVVAARNCRRTRSEESSRGEESRGAETQRSRIRRVPHRTERGQAGQKASDGNHRCWRPLQSRSRAGARG